MTVFKTFLKVLKKNKANVIIYTVILIFFAGFNMKSSDNNMNFEATTPDILIINNDEEEGLTKDLIAYISKNSNIIDIASNENAINDALFYRDVNYIIYIPKYFRKNFLNHQNPEIEIKTTNDYPATLANLLLDNYLTTASIYNNLNLSENELIAKVNSNLAHESKITMTTKLDTDNLNKATFYFNFTNYCFLATCVFIICLIMSSFKEEKVKKRTIISSLNYQKFNRELLLSSALFAVSLWIVYCILSFIFVGNIMFSLHGLLYIINSFFFMLVSLVLALLIGNIITNKEAVSGLVNVIALGSSFLCGAFVPAEYLPTSVLKIAHVLPSFWFINNNDLIKSLEIINFETLKPFIFNIFMIIIFILIFISITNIVSKKKMVIA